MKPEWLAIATNSITLGYYLIWWQGPGKPLYWLGGLILMFGILLMKG